MFTGIIENLAEIVAIENSKGNLNITLSSSLTSELKVDQSVSHNGICLTVVSLKNDEYTVTAIEETINKTTINKWQKGDLINLERAMKIGDRLDGHMIQGHVDQIGKCINSEIKNGSWEYTIEYEKSDNITVEKGSIAINAKKSFNAGCDLVLHCNGNLREMNYVALHSPFISKFIVKKTSQFYKILS